jgi:hypothetical protein
MDRKWISHLLILHGLFLLQARPLWRKTESMTTASHLKLAFAIALMAASLSCMAQDCSSLRLDLRTGTLNGVSPTDSPEQVKALLPCFTGETEEGVEYNFGGGVFYLDHDFYFYTHRDYLEVRSGFVGTVSQPLMGASEERVLALMGKPKRKMEDWSGREVWLYKAKYGSLRVTYGSSSDDFLPGVEMIGIHRAQPREVNLND